MSPQRKREIVTWVTIAVSVATLFGTATAYARSSFTSTMSGKVDVTRYERDRSVDSAWKSEQQSMLLDVLCSRNVDPRNQRCR